MITLELTEDERATLQELCELAAWTLRTKLKSKPVTNELLRKLRLPEDILQTETVLD